MARLVGVAVLALVVAGTGGADIAIGAKRGGAAPSATAPVTLTVTKEGRGTVTSSPPGISCGTQCTASFPAGTVVTLSQAPDASANFGLWGGACSGTPLAPTCTVRMTAPTTVVAAFIGVEVNRAAFATTWSQSTLRRGTLTVSGVASHAATLTATLRAPSGKLVTGTVNVPAPGGPFTITLRLQSSGFMPGGYGLRFTGTILGRPYNGPLIGIEMAAPREGLVRDAWISPTGSTRRVARLRSARSITAFFLWATRASAGSRVVTTWFYNGRNTKVTRVQPRFLPAISHVLRFRGGQQLPKGTYRCVLTARGKIVKTATIRIG